MNFGENSSFSIFLISELIDAHLDIQVTLVTWPT